MDTVTIARIIHILSIVFWIGGVAMVTTVVTPLINKNGFDIFDKVEHNFSKQAKISTLLAGISGFYMIYELNIWSRFFSLDFWWMHAMVLIWTLFTLVLFIFEPLFLDKLFRKYSSSHPKETARFISVFHWVLLLLSLLTISGAMYGVHGGF